MTLNSTNWDWYWDGDSIVGPYNHSKPGDRNFIFISSQASFRLIASSALCGSLRKLRSTPKSRNHIIQPSILSYSFTTLLGITTTHLPAKSGERGFDCHSSLEEGSGLDGEEVLHLSWSLCSHRFKEFDIYIALLIIWDYCCLNLYCIVFYY